MANNEELFKDICNDLDDRKNWESRQVLWTRMRKQGNRRGRKPWPGAADMHVPIGDTIIGKLKAYYIQWVFGPELLASFYSLKSQGDSYTDSVAQWFDYQIRECSNFTNQMMCAIDSCLQNGMGFVKTYFDVDKETVAFASVHPYFIITPPWTTDINESDRFVHAMHLSKAEYKRKAESRGYNQDETYLDTITGEGKPDQKYEEVRYSAEGLSYSRLKDLIVLWEVYERGSDGQISVQTFSPLQPDEPARATFKLPYEHKQIPITLIPYELLDESFYSSRGVMELIQMFEASACKMWNEKLDFMSIANRPVLSSQGGSINAQNIRWEPGAVYDSVLQLIQQPAPPVSFDQEIANTRSMAEQRVGIPDFGLGQSNNQKDSRTATETNAITTVMQQSNDLRARVSKHSITRVYEQAWSLLKQYKKDSLDYFWRKERVTLSDAVFDNPYVLRPNGSVDGYSREKEIQKLMQLRQLAQNSPWIKVAEIDRKIIELMDSQWISEVYEEPADAAADQQEQQAIENAVMLDGFLPQVEPNDEHVTHLQIEDGFIGWRGQQGDPIPPQLITIFMQHMTAHIETARQDPQYMKQHGAQIAQFANKVAQTQKEMALEQKAQTSIAALRGGAGAPQPAPNGGTPQPVAPPSMPQPGQPTGLGPQMPPGGLPPNPTNGTRGPGL